MPTKVQTSLHTAVIRRSGESTQSPGATFAYVMPPLGFCDTSLWEPYLGAGQPSNVPPPESAEVNGGKSVIRLHSQVWTAPQKRQGDSRLRR